MKSHTTDNNTHISESLPSRERGLKFRRKEEPEKPFCVAPFAGAWIEIKMGTDPQDKAIVAPFAGAWIEILTAGMWKPGNHVAPFAGAWIEI